MKGDGEAHPVLSPNDEFANFETLGQGQLRPRAARRRHAAARVRPRGLKRGLAYEAKLGVNPFKFGMVGSTDAHTSLSTTDERQLLRQGRRRSSRRRIRSASTK